MLTPYLLLLLTALCSVQAAAVDEHAAEKEAAYWHAVGKDDIKATQEKFTSEGRAKNVILFLGDGMGPTTVTAGRIMAGQMKGLRGEDHELSFDKFPFTGLSKTYNLDRQVTDSAASATAYLCGVKGNQYTLGVNGKTLLGQCSTMNEDTHVTSILRWSANAKKSVGVVTTTRITHASPAASYAHCPHRDWETDRKIPPAERSCEDIALQLISRNQDIQVILGGGRASFLPDGMDDPDPNPNFNMSSFSREDGQNLVQMWIDDKINKSAPYKYVFNKKGFDAVDASKTDYLLGLLSQDHLQYEVDRDKNQEPSLAELTEKAISILSKNDKGFFLMVEGGRIDHGHHETKASKALHDVAAFSDAVQKAADMTDKSDTLIVVTADHSHVMSIAGYPKRGNPILGLVDPQEVTDDSLPYTTIIYGNGQNVVNPRENLTNVKTDDKEWQMPAAVPVDYETHGGEDVAIYARGPQSHLYTGVHEQSYIPMVMAYASCVGPFENDCASGASAVDAPRTILLVGLFSLYRLLVALF